MKNGLAAFVLCVIGGCAAGEERVDTSGNHPAAGKAEPMTPAARDAEVDTGQLQVEPQAGYTVYDQDGRKVAHQAAGAVDLKLAPGRYFVAIDEPVQGPRKFWVTVEKGKLTRVDSKGAPAEVR